MSLQTQLIDVEDDLEAVEAWASIQDQRILSHLQQALAWIRRAVAILDESAPPPVPTSRNRRFVGIF